MFELVREGPARIVQRDAVEVEGVVVVAALAEGAQNGLHCARRGIRRHVQMESARRRRGGVVDVECDAVAGARQNESAGRRGL